MIDDDVLRAIDVRAARTGRTESDVVEAAVRRNLGLDLMTRLWTRSELSADEAMEMAIEAQRGARPTRSS